MKIAVFGLGYVGLSNAVLLAQHNRVVAVDISAERVAMVNARTSPIIDAELQDFLTGRDLDLSATTNAAEALADVLTIEWGLQELKLEGGMIEDEASLKSVLHALLVSGTLGMLSLAGSRKVRAGGWGLLAVFLRKGRVSLEGLLRVCGPDGRRIRVDGADSVRGGASR